MTDFPKSEIAIRPGSDPDLESCVSLWVEACAMRDGLRVPGVAERARPKFAHREAWIVAEGPGPRLAGFVLATAPGSGHDADPPGAPVVGLLAVDPVCHGLGVGSTLLASVTSTLAARGHEQAVLHVLTSNTAAVALYESQGWRKVGPTFEHTLLRKPFQSYLRDLRKE
jgi:ribosomal protein S18 acetylase RimI-like enzyme